MGTQKPIFSYFLEIPKQLLQESKYFFLFISKRKAKNILLVKQGYVS